MKLFIVCHTDTKNVLDVFAELDQAKKAVRLYPFQCNIEMRSLRGKSYIRELELMHMERKDNERKNSVQEQTAPMEANSGEGRPLAR